MCILGHYILYMCMCVFNSLHSEFDINCGQNLLFTLIYSFYLVVDLCLSGRFMRKSWITNVLPSYHSKEQQQLWWYYSLENKKANEKTHLNPSMSKMLNIHFSITANKFCILSASSFRNSIITSFLLFDIYSMNKPTKFKVNQHLNSTHPSMVWISASSPKIWSCSNKPPTADCCCLPTDLCHGWLDRYYGG